MYDVQQDAERGTEGESLKLESPAVEVRLYNPLCHLSDKGVIGKHQTTTAIYKYTEIIVWLREQSRSVRLGNTESNPLPDAARAWDGG